MAFASVGSDDQLRGGTRTHGSYATPSFTPRTVSPNMFSSRVSNQERAPTRTGTFSATYAAPQSVRTEANTRSVSMSAAYPPNVVVHHHTSHPDIVVHHHTTSFDPQMNGTPVQWSTNKGQGWVWFFIAVLVTVVALVILL